MSSLIGKTLGQYQILSELGRGGMAVVYRAYQRSLERNVALKLMQDALATDREFVERFLREARIAAGLNQPNIVTIYEVSANAPYYIAMELIDGESLTQTIRRVGHFDPARAAGILRQVAAALDFAHARGVIHRDLKPSNILLDRTGRVVLTDFGIAKAVSNAQLTRAGTLMGTPGYMAPEVLIGSPASAQTDVYALGIVLYEMLAGAAPFRGNTPLAIMNQHAKTPPPPLRQFNPAISPAVERVVQKAIAKQPAQRYGSAGALAQAFAAAVSGQRVAASKSRTPFIAAMLGIAIALVLLFALFFVSTQNQNPGTGSQKTTSVPVSVIESPAATFSAIFTSTAPATSSPASAPTLTPPGTPNQTATVLAEQTLIAQLIETRVRQTAEIGQTTAAESARSTAIISEFIATQTASAPTAMPIPTDIPTATHAPTRPPPTAVPTATPIPPTPTRAFPPNIYVTGLRVEPAAPKRNQQVVFYATFLNSTGGPNEVTWAVRIFGPNDDKRFGLTSWTRQKIAGGESELISQNDWYVKGPGACQHFYAMPVFLNDENSEILFPNTEGGNTRTDFDVCP